MNFLANLFGPRKTAQAAAPAETYQGFAITPAPQRDGGQWRVAAKIEKDGKTHQLIRADTLTSQDEAAKAALNKAKQLIDEQGDTIFD